MSRLLLVDPEIGCSLRPNRVTYEIVNGRPNLCRTNSAGFRSDWEFEEKRGKKLRVLLFGDSFAEGHLLGNQYRFSDRISLNQSLFEIYNFAVAGTGTDQQYCLFRKYVGDIEFDAVIIAPADINICRNMVSHTLYIHGRGKVGVPKPRFEIGADGALEFREPNGEPLLGWEFPKEWHWGGTRSWLPYYDSADGAAWATMRAIIQRWFSELDVPVIIVPLPSFYFATGATDPASFNARWQETAEELQIPIFNITQFFTRLPLSIAIRCFLPDGHYSGLGHHFISEWIQPMLQSSLKKRSP